MKRRVLMVLPAVVLLAAATPASALYGSAPADDAAKRKAKCKKGQVRVKVGKRVTCRPLRKVMPKPRAGDPRKLFTAAVLKRDWSKFRDRRGRRAQSLPKLIRKVGRGAPALFNKAISRGLGRLDAMEASAAGARLRAGPAAVPDCATATRGQRVNNNFTTGGGGGGPSATVGVSLGPDGASMGVELTGDEFSVKADIDMGLCDPNEVEAPSCPSSLGKLDGKIRYKFKVAIAVMKGGTDFWSTGAETVRTTKLTGWNAVDAKLDTLDVEDVETSTLTAGGESRGHPPISIRTRINRTTSVDMRSGSYNAGDSRLDVRIDMEGLYGPDRDDAETDAERRAQSDADKQWRAVIKKAIDGYGSREEGWQEPTCATLKFSPENNSRTLHGGDTGSMRATAIAKSDGQPSEIDARLTNIENAIFEPSRAGGQSSANFTYRNVANATAPGAKVRAKVHATSKAGVAEDTWEQPIAPPFKINQIAGNFSGSYTQSGYSTGRTAHVTWTGAGTFRRNPADFPGALGNYGLIAGQATYHFSGQTLTAHAACDMSGSEFVDIFQDGGGAIGVQPLDMTKPFEQGPHGYGGDVTLGPDPKVTLTMENCAPGAESEEGKQYEYPVGFPPLDTGDNQASADGIHYEGSYTDTQGSITTHWEWVLEGSLKDP